MQVVERSNCPWGLLESCFLFNFNGWVQQAGIQSQLSHENQTAAEKGEIWIQMKNCQVSVFVGSYFKSNINSSKCLKIQT